MVPARAIAEQDAPESELPVAKPSAGFEEEIQVFDGDMTGDAEEQRGLAGWNEGNTGRDAR